MLRDDGPLHGVVRSDVEAGYGCVAAGVRVVFVPFCSVVVTLWCGDVLIEWDWVIACGCRSSWGEVVVHAWWVLGGML